MNKKKLKVTKYILEDFNPYEYPAYLEYLKSLEDFILWGTGGEEPIGFLNANLGATKQSQKWGKKIGKLVEEAKMESMVDALILWIEKRIK